MDNLLDSSADELVRNIPIDKWNMMSEEDKANMLQRIAPVTYMKGLTPEHIDRAFDRSNPDKSDDGSAADDWKSGNKSMSLWVDLLEKLRTDETKLVTVQGKELVLSPFGDLWISGSMRTKTAGHRELLAVSVTPDDSPLADIYKGAYDESNSYYRVGDNEIDSSLDDDINSTSVEEMGIMDDAE